MKKNVNDELQSLIHWSHSVKNRKVKIFVAAEQTLRLKKNRLQSFHRWVCRKRCELNAKSRSAFFVSKTKISRMLNAWRLSRLAATSRSTFIASISAIIQTVSQSRVPIPDATSYWITKCICRTMRSGFTQDLYLTVAGPRPTDLRSGGAFYDVCIILTNRQIRSGTNLRFISVIPSWSSQFGLSWTQDRVYRAYPFLFHLWNISYLLRIRSRRVIFFSNERASHQIIRCIH